MYGKWYVSFSTFQKLNKLSGSFKAKINPSLYFYISIHIGRYIKLLKSQVVPLQVEIIMESLKCIIYLPQ